MIQPQYGYVVLWRVGFIVIWNRAIVIFRSTSFYMRGIYVNSFRISNITFVRVLIGTNLHWRP